MIDIDKDYLITVNLKNTKIKSDKTLFFYNTDLNICNIFIQLVCTDSDKTIPDDLIVEFAVLKPETNEFKPLDATLISKEDLLYQVDLTTDYLDIIGTYECEIRVSGTIDNEKKCFTSESFDYVVRPNITAKLNNQIKQDKNLPILEKLIKEVNDIGLGIEMNQVQLKKDDNLVGDNKTIVGAINQLREDVDSGGKVELTDYQKKTDDNLATEEKTIVGAVNEINSKTITLEKDDTSFDGVDDTIHDTLNTTDKRIIGAINEVNAQYKDIAKQIEQGGTGGGNGLTQTQITALDNMFKICAYTSSDITTQYNEFKSAFGISGENPPSSVTLVSISATCNSANQLVGTLAKDLNITVIAHYSDNSVIEVKDWTTEGTVQLGENTFIITYKDKTATVKVNGVSSSDGSFVSGEIINPIVISNSYVDKTSGKFIESDGWSRTDYIGCKGASKIKLTITGTLYSSQYNAFYDSNKNFISSFAIGSVAVIDVPTNAVYFVISEITEEFSKFTIKCLGDVEVVRGDWVNGKAFELSLINDAYINQDNGTVSTYEGWTTTDYLNCGKANTLEITSTSTAAVYSSSYNAFYDGNKEFISNFSIVTIPCNIEVPTTAQYVRISNKTDDMNNIVITPRE